MWGIPGLDSHKIGYLQMNEGLKHVNDNLVVDNGQHNGTL